ncbi:hypothetical protein DPMN_093784 [Dreissena polymorpha]|uniref:Uncharacterized protein n=1 Tax=Dreissena polymorpha TaxID=45954 RepID=A0A9D4L4Q8_DREPO|nr:hypothetical protein DPMN_093784 [Dreissena polymorpha]
MSADQVKSHCKVNERIVKRHTLFSSLSLELAYCKDHVGGGSVGAESTLGFRIDSCCMGLKSVKEYASKDLPNHAQQRDVSVVV